MPVELSALMIKSAPEGQRPSMEAFPVSGGSSLSHQLLTEVEAAVPLSTSENDEGCLLNPREAKNLLSSWHERHYDPEGDLSLGSEFAKQLPAMIGLAQAGHAMVLMVE
jgi:hypothetical protein